MANPTINLDAEARTAVGTRDSRRLRKAGKLPAVVYGHGKDAESVALTAKPFNDSLRKGAHVFALALGGGATQNVLLKDVQFDHLGKDVIHVDFARVDLNERVTVTVPLVLKGTPKGEAEGGKLQQVLSDLEIECTVTEIPSEVTHSVADLELDAALHVSELKLPANVTAVTDGETVVAVVHAIADEPEADAAAEGGTGGAEPEVITKGKADEEGAAEEKK